MSIIIDIQFCKDAKNSFIPKEVAVLSLDCNHLAHWIVLPPYRATKLPLKIRNENKWLRQSLHGLDWDEGTVSRKALCENLQQITKNYDKVYVRGEEKKKFLDTIILNDVINLESNEDNPAFKELPWNDSYCMIHALRMANVGFNCALNNTHRLKKWLLEQPNDLAINEQFGDLEDIIGDI